MIENRIAVLDKGYVRLVELLGSDTTIVNAARVSFDREVTRLKDRDVRLIHYLVLHRHTSPFRHAMMQFEIYAPLMVARQWWKYVVGSAHDEGTEGFDTNWNESSRRYVTETPQFMIPQPLEWRKAPESRKQGSGGLVDWAIGDEATRRLMASVERGLADYEWALEAGICAEQARLNLLAYGLYVRWYWTASLQAVAHFLCQRLADDAQKETQHYAEAIKALSLPRFPIALEALISSEEKERAV